MTGYYEADWLSSGTTSNNNQSNSYTMRQRELWADAKTTSGWDFSGGTGWSLVTETTSGLTRGTEILPSTIDAQYDAGFVWSRQESFRVSKNIGSRPASGMSAENAETLNAGGQNLPIELHLRLRRHRRRPLRQSVPTTPSTSRPTSWRRWRCRARLGPLGSLRHRPHLPRPHLSLRDCRPPARAYDRYAEHRAPARHRRRLPRPACQQKAHHWPEGPLWARAWAVTATRPSRT